MAVPPAQSGGTTVATGGADANGIGLTATTTDSYSFNVSESTLSEGGLSYQETYSFNYDVQTVPAATWPSSSPTR